MSVVARNVIMYIVILYMHNEIRKLKVLFQMVYDAIVNIIYGHIFL